MLKTLKRLAISFFVAVFLLNISLLPGAESLGKVEASTLVATKGRVSSSILNIRKTKSTKAKRIALLHKGDKVTLLTNNTKWVTVKVNGKIGYTQGKYIKTSYGNASSVYADTIKGTVSSSILNIRSAKSTSAKRLTTLRKGAKVTCLTTDQKWVKVKVGSIVGYTQGQYIKTANGGTASSTATKGQQVVNYALKFVGNPYRWGGTSLTHGADCSGFVMSVYRHFGKSLPHSSYAQRGCGRRVSSLSKAKPGDIICYSGHVAIYMGNNKVVHASNPKSGIKITKGAAYRSIVTIRRIF